jgi:hypothetical protein
MSSMQFEIKSHYDLLVVMYFVVRQYPIKHRVLLNDRFSSSIASVSIFNFLNITAQWLLVCRAHC